MDKTYLCILLMVLYIFHARGVAGLIAYDCGDANVDISTVSLRNVAKCPDPSSSYKSESLDVTVFQRDEIGLQHVWSCLVEVTRLITYCGMHSHSSVVSGGLLNYIHQVGADECRQIHRYRTLKLQQETIGGIVLNGTTTASVTLFGSVDNSGRCDGITYQENGQSWHNVIVTATVKIQLKDYFATVKLKDNEISLQGGVTCPFLKGYCFDSTLGEVTWDNEKPTDCDGKLSLLHLGKAEKITNVRTSEEYMVVNQDSKIFAVTLMKKVRLCSVEVWQTEHPKLLVAEGTLQALPLSHALIPQNTDLMAYINSKFLYVEQSQKRDIDALYIDTIHRRCMVQREILKNRLLLAPIVPDMVSQIIQGKEGFLGHVLGEVLYILRCVPKQVEIRRTESCYQELPIRVDNQSKFMAPITRIIQNHGEEIECHSLTPPLYNVEGEWIGLNPHPVEKRTPKEIEVSTSPLINFQPIQPLGSKGLYTQEEIEKVQKLVTFGHERKVVENIIARRVAGMETGSQGFSTLGMFNQEEIQEIAHSTMKQMWGWFSDLGVFMSGLIGFYFIFCIVKYTVGVVINALNLYKTIGGGFALLASLWSTLTLWVIHDYKKPNSCDTDEDGEELKGNGQKRSSMRNTQGQTSGTDADHLA